MVISNIESGKTQAPLTSSTVGNNNSYNNTSMQRNARANRSNSSNIIVDQVGFSSLPEQVHRKSLKKGFEFTLLVVGDSGLGKSTLVDSLFMTDLYTNKPRDSVADRIKKTVSITSHTTELEEKGVRLKLTVVDTPGFGDAINLTDSWAPIEQYIDEQFNSFYQHETGFGSERRKMVDTRVHCCLYFIPPYVRGLRPIDIQTMRSLQTRVNIVPLIAKADSLTRSELDQLKQNILLDIEKHKVKIYEFPLCDSDDDDSFKKLDAEIKNALPFAVIGSDSIIEAGNKRVRGRVYPWGVVDIESDSACDFNRLRTFLCSSHMQDLKDLTHDVHYENYRTELITKSSLSSSSTMNATAAPLATPQTPRNSNGSVIMTSNRRPSADETDKLLQQKDMELKKMQELIAKMKLNMDRMNGNGSGDLSFQSSDQSMNTNTSSSPANSAPKTTPIIVNAHAKPMRANAPNAASNSNGSGSGGGGGSHFHNPMSHTRIINHSALVNSTPI